MNRTPLAMVLLVAIIGIFIVFQSAQPNSINRTLGASNSPLQVKIHRNSEQLIDATHRLAYHCRMVIIESLVIAKQSINVVLDTAIESL